MKKKFKEQDHHFVGLGCDNIEIDRTVRNVMLHLSGLKKIVKGLSDRFDEYEGSKVFKDKRALEKELVNERNGKEFYREFGEYMCRMLQNRQNSKGSFPFPISSDAAIAAATVATSGIEDDDDDDAALMDSQPYKLRRSPRDTQGNPPPSLTQDTVNWMIHESVEAAIWAKRERVQNEANHAEGPNIASVARECTFADFMKCSPITFYGNKGPVGLIRRIKKTKMVFTASKCTEANKVVFVAATFQDRALTWWNSQNERSCADGAHFNGTEREADNKKRKWKNFQGGSSSSGGNNNSNRNNNNYNSNRNYNNNHNNNQNQYRNNQNNQRQGNVRAMTNVGNQNTNEAGQKVKCNRCGMQHYGNCPIKCNKYGKIRYKARDCVSKMVATGANAQPIVTCYGYEEKGRIKTNCPARNNPRRSGACGQAYALRDGDQNLRPNVVTDHSCEVKLADGRVVSTNTILKGCALNSVNHLLEIYLMPIELGTFDVIIRMDWLILHDAVIFCGKKEVDVPFKKRTLVVKVIEKELAERRLEDVPVIYKFLDVFPEDLPRLPPPRQMEFKSELVPGAAHVARAPYRLAPSGMKELAKQLQDAPILALPEGSEDFVVYCDALLKGYGAVLMQREKRRWIELLSDYGCEIRYHLRKANVVADALGRKEREKPLRPTFCQKKKTDSIEKLAELFLKEIVCRHGVPVSVISDRDSLFTSSWDKHMPLVEFSYNNSYHASIKAAPFEALYGRKYVVIPLDEVQLDNKLHFVEEPVKIMDREVKRHKQSRILIVKVRWNSRRRQEFTWEQPVEVVDREVKQSRIPIVKVRWNSQIGPQFTWEREDQIKKKYHHLFTSKDDAKKSG
nr:hypothetical protein [Tanacetum cinerariifolium]